MTKRTKIKVPSLPNDGKHEYMALASQCWARDADWSTAAKNLLKIAGHSPERALIVPKGARVNAIGTAIEWPLESGHPDGACPHCIFK